MTGYDDPTPRNMRARTIVKSVLTLGVGVSRAASLCVTLQNWCYVAAP